MTWTFRVPGYLPPTLNTLLRRHWTYRRRAQKECSQLVACYARQAGVPAAAGRRRVTLAFSSPRPPADPDARLKLLLDALVACGALADDSPRLCEPAPPLSLKGPRGVTITLEDVP